MGVPGLKYGLVILSSLSSLGLPNIYHTCHMDALLDVGFFSDALESSQKLLWLLTLSPNIIYKFFFNFVQVVKIQGSLFHTEILSSSSQI